MRRCSTARSWRFALAEVHEGALDEAGLRLCGVGDATVAVDEPLVKRALSNLLGNATRPASA